jgi:hypothetical protein
MKLTALRLTIAAAATLAAASTASAQKLTAEIPFAFEVSGVRMQPGSYSVSFTSPGSATRVLRIYNESDRRAVVAVPQSASTPLWAEAKKPALTFACADGRCTLAGMRDASATSYRFAMPKGGEMHMATILLRPDRGE